MAAQSMGSIGAASAAATQGATVSGSSGASGFQKDVVDPSTEPKFGDVLKRMQSQYGAKAEKPREIKKTLGKDDFLRIMITQMQHQDPSNPFKAEQMAAEMAQFTSVEQMSNMNRSLEKMTTKDQPLERLAMTNLIGKTVTVDRSRFPHQEGSNEALNFHLPKDATEVKIALVGENGEVAIEKDIGPQKAGENTFAWDGLKTNTLPAKAGTYMLRVEAKDERGQTIDVNSQGKAKVVGVSFEGSEPVFLVGDARNQVKVTMKNIVRIDEVGGATGAPMAAPAMSRPPMGGAMGGATGAANPAGNAGSAQPSASALQAVAPEQGKPNFIAFQKGVGSSNFDPTQAPKETAEAIAKFEGANSDKNEKGFPNGLHD